MKCPFHSYPETEFVYTQAYLQPRRDVVRWRGKTMLAQKSKGQLATLRFRRESRMGHMLSMKINRKELLTLDF